MSKQRYILILLLLCLLKLSAEVNFQSGFYSAMDGTKTTYLNQSRLTGDFTLIPNLQLSFNSKLDATDRKLGDFPQEKWMNNFAGLDYTRKHWSIQAGYRNLYFGSPELLKLYPDWKADTDYQRKTQHQSQLSLNGNLIGISLSAYGMQKQLMSIPVEYSYDFNTDTMIPIEGSQTGLKDNYYGVELAYSVTPFLSISGAADRKQADYTENSVYNLNTLALGAQMELKPTATSRFSGSFDWQNREGAYVIGITRNVFRTTLRYQQQLSAQTYCFLSLINNSCTDDQLNEVYIISDYIRSHVQYRFNSDPSQQSYILVGGKACPENKTNAIFCEGQMRLIPNFYSFLGLNVQPDSQNTYQGKLSYFFSPVSDCYLHYTINDSSLLDLTTQYIGIGTSIHY